MARLFNPLQYIWLKWIGHSNFFFIKLEGKKSKSNSSSFELFHIFRCQISYKKYLPIFIIKKHFLQKKQRFLIQFVYNCKLNIISSSNESKTASDLNVYNVLFYITPVNLFEEYMVWLY